MHGLPKHNTWPHTRLPPSFLGMDVWMTSQLNVALNRKLHHYRKCAHRAPLRPLLVEWHRWGHSVLPLCFLPFAIPRERYVSGRYWPCRSLSLWVKCSQLWQCRRGVNTRRNSLTDFHLQWKIEYKIGFIWNNYKKVGYLIRKCMIHWLAA